MIPTLLAEARASPLEYRMTEFVHDTLPCGMEYAVLPLPQRHVVSFQLRVLAGTTSEPAKKLGLARLVEDTITKGTEKRTGPQLSDAFDAIGAGKSSGTGRETSTFTCTVLPDYFEQAVALHAEFFRTPTFPDDAFRVNVDLAKQELMALEDDAHALCDKLLDHQAFGPLLGRHPLGENETLDRISRDDVEAHWRSYFRAGRILLAVSGAVEPQRVADLFEKHFGGFGGDQHDGRSTCPFEFSARSTHHHKESKQEQIGICWPGVDATHDDFPVQQVMIGILSGGMSARLFTEVREKLALAYWVAAWQDTPRGAGMIFLGASSTPERCDQTYSALLREVDRLADDITQDELNRAITGIVASRETRGDTTRARCSELATDLFFYGRPLPPEEKIARVQAVTIDHVRRFLSTYPRDQVSVVTLGPRALADGVPSSDKNHGE